MKVPGAKWFSKTSKTEAPLTLQVLTYNIKGMLGRDQAHTLRQLAQHPLAQQVDVLCLQEFFLPHDASWPDFGPFASQLPYRAFGPNAHFPRGALGNAITSRYPLQEVSNVDLSVFNRERRGALRATLDLPHQQKICLINLHFGLRTWEREQQFGFLKECLQKIPPQTPLIVLGDFNDWKGLLSPKLPLIGPGLVEGHHLLHGHLARTFPALCPLLPLDRIYHSHLTILSAQRLSRGLRWSSDHLPLLQRFALPEVQ